MAFLREGQSGWRFFADDRQDVFANTSAPPSEGSWRRSTCAASPAVSAAGGDSSDSACSPGSTGAIAVGTITYCTEYFASVVSEAHGETAVLRREHHGTSERGLPLLDSRLAATAPSSEGLKRRRRQVQVRSASPSRGSARGSPSPMMRDGAPFPALGGAVKDNTAS